MGWDGCVHVEVDFPGETLVAQFGEQGVWRGINEEALR